MNKWMDEQMMNEQWVNKLYPASYLNGNSIQRVVVSLLGSLYAFYDCLETVVKSRKQMASLWAGFILQLVVDMVRDQLYLILSL